MSIEITVTETSARISKKQLEEKGLSANQLLASMGTTIVDGVEYKITKLIDVDTGLEIT